MSTAIQVAIHKLLPLESSTVLCTTLIYALGILVLGRCSVYPNLRDMCMFHCLGRRNIIFIDVSIMILGLADMRSSVFFYGLHQISPRKRGCSLQRELYYCCRKERPSLNRGSDVFSSFCASYLASSDHVLTY